MNVIVASDCDRDNVFAELWFENVLIAEVTFEEGEYKIEFFSTKKKLFDLEELLNAIALAKSKLK